MVIAELSLSTVLLTLMGGVLIGLAASYLLATQGRMAGISGILAGALRRRPEPWRLQFLGGLLAGGLGFVLLSPDTVTPTLTTPTAGVIAAGLLVGFGTRLGGGCTSGHGVCGLPRFSLRSLVATLTFMAAATVSTAIVLHVL